MGILRRSELHYCSWGEVIIRQPTRLGRFLNLKPDAFNVALYDENAFLPYATKIPLEEAHKIIKEQSLLH